MNDDLLYTEKVVSKKTEVLFITLTVLSLLLLAWPLLPGNPGFLTGVFLFFFAFFLFCTLNYRILVIRLTQVSLQFSFGIFTWDIPLDNISGCQMDDNLPAMLKYGGAGIHFMFVNGRYRASINFLEHPRVLIRLKRKTGLIRDVSFSTRHPDEIIGLIHGALPGKLAA